MKTILRDLQTINDEASTADCSMNAGSPRLIDDQNTLIKSNIPWTYARKMALRSKQTILVLCSVLDRKAFHVSEHCQDLPNLLKTSIILGQYVYRDGNVTLVK